MKYAADFRKIARDALHGHWIIAALTCFIASLIGASIVTSGGIGSINVGNNESSSTGPSGETATFQELLPAIIIIAAVGLFVGLIVIAIHLAVGGPAKLGYAKFNLSLVDKEEARVGDLFSQFGRFADGFLMQLLTELYIGLWSLLFIIPGIVKSFSYSMTPYILYENPNLSANEAITESRKIMDGNKGRLFCLQFSFIGWYLLASVPAFIVSSITAIAAIITSSIIVTAIGALLLIPAVIVELVAIYFISAYQEAAQAAFYREITGTALEYREQPEIPETNETM